jgi:hypothetical protein
LFAAAWRAWTQSPAALNDKPGPFGLLCVPLWLFQGIAREVYGCKERALSLLAYDGRDVNARPEEDMGNKRSCLGKAIAALAFLLSLARPQA